MAENGPIDMSQLVAAQESGAVSNSINFDQPQQTTAVNSLLQEAPEEAKIDISNIQIEEVTHEKIKEEAKTLGESGIGVNMLGKISKFNYRKVVSISVVVMVFALLVSGIAYLRDQYLTIASQPKIDPAYQTYIDYSKDYQKTISEYTHLDDYSALSATSFAGDTLVSAIDSIFKTDRLSYLQKKDILQNGLNSISSTIVTHYNTLDTIKKDITKYGFSPKDLIGVFGDSDKEVSIKKSLLSLEAVKFSAAIKVFSYLDTFIKGLANITASTPDVVQKQMQSLDTRGEKDIMVYLNTCYLNPFEIDENCNLIGDFDKYYQYMEKNTTFDVGFFKKMMAYIDLKLEQSDLPSFSITFQRFDPTQQQISFSVDVNTFKQDEESLLRQGIVNPHVFVVTQLLNLLKQSLFVIGENIDTRQLKITPRVIQIGSATFPVNSSSMSFVLPIQKNPQREIADFVLNKDYYFTQAATTGTTITTATTGAALTGTAVTGVVSAPSVIQ